MLRFFVFEWLMILFGYPIAGVNTSLFGPAVPTEKESIQTQYTYTQTSLLGPAVPTEKESIQTLYTYTQTRQIYITQWAYKDILTQSGHKEIF